MEEPQGFIDNYLKPNNVEYTYDEVPGNRHAVRLFGVVKDPTLEFFNKNLRDWNLKVAGGQPATQSASPPASPTPTLQPTQAPGGIGRRSHSSPIHAGLVAVIAIAGLLLIAGMVAVPLIRSRRSRLGY